MIHLITLFFTLFAVSCDFSFAQVWNSNTCSNLLSCVDQSEQYLREMSTYPQTMGSYNGMQIQDKNSQCSLLRNKMECMMNFSPYCLREDVTRNIGSQITKVKVHLDNQCDQINGWSNTQCYRLPEITARCEPMIREINIGQYNYFAASIPRNICQRYLDFRTCVYNIVLNSCTPMDREKFFSYLLDKTSEISWKCGNDTSYFNQYERWHPISGSMLPGSGYSANQLPPYSYNQGSYGSAIVPTGVIGSSYPSSSGIYGGSYPSIYNPGMGVYDRSRYPSRGYGYGELGAYDESNCFEKTRYTARHCEDNLLQRQRDARNSRSALDIQRRVCCSLFYYQDCLSTAVLKNCRDNSLNVVNLLMGENRVRELTQNCAEYKYDMCNGSSVSFISGLLLVISLLISSRFN